VARAAALGVAALTVAAGAHVAADGALPSMTALAMLAVPLTVAAMVLTGRRCGPALLVGSMTAAQVLLHESLMALTAHVPHEMSGQMSAGSAFAMGGNDMASADGWSVTMTAAHVVASVVAAMLLAHGEQAMWRLACRFLLRLPSEPTVVRCRPLPAPVLVCVPVLAPSVVSGGPGLRGSPARFAVLA
jgi:hypothetical protein